MKFRTFLAIAIASAGCLSLSVGAESPKRKILFFSKSSGVEHDCISYKNGQPSDVEKALLDMGKENNWEFTFSKDGSKFSREYLAPFDTVMFYTSGNLFEKGTDGQPPMTPEGRQALFDHVASGKGFYGAHSAIDTFQTNNDPEGSPYRYINHGEKADPWVRFLGGGSIIGGTARANEIFFPDRNFPGFNQHIEGITVNDEWYSMRDFAPDIHAIILLRTMYMTGHQYKRKHYPIAWVRKHGEGRVLYNGLGHNALAWRNPYVKPMIVSGLKWTLGEFDVDITPNLSQVAKDAMDLPPLPKPGEE